MDQRPLASVTSSNAFMPHDESCDTHVVTKMAVKHAIVVFWIHMCFYNLCSWPNCCFITRMMGFDLKTSNLQLSSVWGSVFVGCMLFVVCWWISWKWWLLQKPGRRRRGRGWVQDTGYCCAMSPMIFDIHMPPLDLYLHTRVREHYYWESSLHSCHSCKAMMSSLQTTIILTFYDN